MRTRMQLSDSGHCNDIHNIINEIHLFVFFSLPPWSIFVVNLSVKHVINLVWPKHDTAKFGAPTNAHAHQMTIFGSPVLEAPQTRIETR